MSWDAFADAYQNAHSIRSDCFPLGPNGPGLIFGQEPLDLTDGARVLDLGCGGGQNAGYLDQHGCEVTGVDASSAQLARAVHAYPSVRFVHAGLLDFLSSEESSTYDFAYAVFSLEYIPSLGTVFRGLQRLLADDGRFLYVDLHPFSSSAHLVGTSLPTFSRTTSYFDEGPRPFTWTIGATSIALTRFHRTLASIVRTASGAGFGIRGVLEPPIEWDLIAPPYEDPTLREQREVWDRFPYTIVLDFKKLRRCIP